MSFKLHIYTSIEKVINLSLLQDGWLFLWNPKIKNPIQKLDLNEIFNNEQNENNKKEQLGVYRFAYNSLTGDLLVNMYK